ncbi:MAG TPA: ATP synthase F1 subunit delta, partial [Firmicutes bacterium]|nr:ATP synthase F1 subunit delta [Bacillota bacterium]
SLAMKGRSEKLVLEAQNTAVAEVTSAVTLSDASLARLTKRLEELSRKKIILRNKVDPKIGGGLIIRIGGRVVDASVSNALQRLAQSLSLDK